MGSIGYIAQLGAPGLCLQLEIRNAHAAAFRRGLSLDLSLPPSRK